ncbi:succinate dehydrogenase cytochrome b subunit [Moheibacter sediminis]|uniref:Succinate dehydrogenase / fumarate reductase cytochrome b subunit n=1 Tax=Moheibacter sediminis TaxID=1434700 RepID=A0A1W2C3Q5_9FLAO|nr:succinate dehydrogenase cytochrome b subunit [Moheibacter sediminis]SMC79877.1 succinate dehydrogenase / fumarate reductase cytochrome b subunit [Moheibacter sediminis]
MAKESLLRSSIGKKFTMALSALFLVLFLGQHFVLNSLAVICPAAFNEASHFMGYQPIVQFVIQPILIIAVVYHFVMGFVLEIQNKKARGPVGYAVNNSNANSTWASRNMIWSGATILAFLVLHFIDFWIPEIAHKYVHFLPEDPNRYYPELMHKFENPIRVAAYVISFFLLMMHLLHGFQSAFQSMGANHRKYTPFIKSFGKAFAIVVPVGFMLIAIICYLKNIEVL